MNPYLHICFCYLSYPLKPFVSCGSISIFSLNDIFCTNCPLIPRNSQIARILISYESCLCTGVFKRGLLAGDKQSRELGMSAKEVYKEIPNPPRKSSSAFQLQGTVRTTPEAIHPPNFTYGPKVEHQQDSPAWSASLSSEACTWN